MPKKFFIGAISILILLLTSGIFSQNVVINEIMNAPQGGEPEWIEILNFSFDPVNLKNWKISNRNTSTKYTITTSDYILKPDSYAVITKSDAIFNFHSIIPSKIFIVPQMPTYLFRNDSDAVVIFDSSDVVIDSVYYKRTWVVSGYSIERIYPNKNSNLKSTWGISIDSEKSTPGRKNSIMANFNDISVKSFSIEPSQIFQGQTFKVIAMIHNLGINIAQNFTVGFYVDINKDFAFQDNEKLAELIVTQAIESTDSILVELIVDGLLSGTYKSMINVTLQDDENLLNNSFSRTLTILPPPLSFNSVVVNEIMYAPKSPEPEWIELFNLTSQPINLMNWKVGDSQTLKTINLDFVLNPLDFAIIASKDTIFSIYPWLTSNANKVLIFSLPALNNDEDVVRIYDQYGNLIDSVYYFSSMGGATGFSLERISPNQPSNSITNWGTSKSIFKATPLLKNSLTQKDKDLTITNAIFSSPVLKLVPLKINLIVKNIGKYSLSNFSVRIFNDENEDKIPQQNELLDEKIYYESLNSGDSIGIVFLFTPTKIKTYSIIATILHIDDEDTLNNTFSFKINVSYPKGTILISEIMFAPLDDEPEWLEIYNAGSDTINLKDWQISDMSSKVTITKSDLYVYPNEYIILSKDNSILNFYSIPSKIITLPLPTLNNSSDAVILYDRTGVEIDSVYYFGIWGKPGVSIERIDFYEPSNDSSNWAIPPDSVRATPGKENFSKRKNYDLRIRSIVAPSSVDYGEILIAKLTLQNVGLNQINKFAIKVYKDLDLDSIPDASESIFSKDFQTVLNKKDSIQISIDIQSIDAGENFLIFFLDLSEDENLNNNILIKKTKVSFPSNCVVINEIMFEPILGYCEYVELFNRSNRAVNLKNWKFNDMRNQDGKANFILISSTDLVINPSEYFVFASDSTFYKYFENQDSLNFKFVILNKSLGLNNDFDDVVITDLTGKVIDSLRYFSNWHSPMILDKRGRSLEKINPKLPSPDRSSWTTSASKIGGTPGTKNTSYIDISQQPQITGTINVSPNPFSPDGDGFNDVCLISYSLPFNSGVINVKVFDSYGRLIKTLAANQFTTRNGNLLWDGTNENGKVERIGIYIVLFEATSESGETFKQKFTIVLAKKI